MTRIESGFHPCHPWLVLMASCLCPYRRPEPVGSALAGLVPSASAVAAAVHVVAPQAAAAAERAAQAPLVADAGFVAVVHDSHVAPAGSASELIPDASAVAVAAAARLHVAVVAAAVAIVLVLRRVRHAAVVVVAQVSLHAQLVVHSPRVRLDADRFAGVVVPARYAVVRVAHSHCHVVVELADPAAEQPAVVTFALLAEHHARDARLAPGTSVPSRDRALCSRGDPSPGSDGIATPLAPSS